MHAQYNIIIFNSETCNCHWYNWKGKMHLQESKGMTSSQVRIVHVHAYGVDDYLKATAKRPQSVGA